MTELVVLILLFAGFGVYGALAERADTRTFAQGPPSARGRRRNLLRRLIARLARSSRQGHRCGGDR